MPSARTVLLLVTASIAIAAVPVAFADQPNPENDAARIARLIKQLGSESCAEREGATEALRGVGETALPALRQAANDSPDAEVRARARRLSESLEFRAIDTCLRRLSSGQGRGDNAGRLGEWLNRKSMAEVAQFLGPAGNMVPVPGGLEVAYPKFELLAEYRQGRLVRLSLCPPIN